LKKILLGFLAAVWVAAGIVHYLLFWPVTWEGPTRVVEAKQGEAAKAIAGRLKEAGVIKSANAFRWLARLTGEHKKIKKGTYSFSPGISLYRALQYMTTDKAGVIILAVPEGSTIRKIAGLAASAVGIDSAAFVNLCQSRTFARLLGFNAPNLEGYLFPSNYEFYWGVSPEEVARKMAESFKEAWKSVADSIPVEPLDMTKAATMASLIEAETGVDSERVIISQVFHRRLKLGYPLQCDPTVIYAMGEIKRGLTREDLKFRSPYNTYVNKGLPPGPICNPGKAALRAALHPDSTKFLYFVANGDGGHIFSQTLDQHNRSVYRLKRQNRL
jgi:UPF0755 protein